MMREIRGTFSLSFVNLLKSKCTGWLKEWSVGTKMTGQNKNLRGQGMIVREGWVTQANRLIKVNL